MTAATATASDGLVRGTVLDGYGNLLGGGLELGPGGRIARVLPADPDRPPGMDGWITPGLIDVHCHGGGGVSFPDMTEPGQVRRAVEAHRRLGTTGLIASLVSSRDPLPCLRMLVDACRRGELLGIHLEGPYVSPHKAGAQNPAAIRPPDLDELRTWLEAGEGFVRTMTLAPEVDGALDAARLLLERGARPSWGHTVADGPTTRAVLEATASIARHLGVAAPAQTVTHLFNAMPPLGHREPGPVLEFLRAARRGKAVVELVADGVHLAPELVGEVCAWVGATEAAGSDEGLGMGGASAPAGGAVPVRAMQDPGVVAFVTDAMEGAGMPDGAYTLGSLPVTIEGGVARLTDGGAIAGGTARMAEEVARMVRGGHVAMGDAIRAAVAGPARAIGVDASAPGVTLTPQLGARADLVVWDAELRVTRVLQDGGEEPVEQ